ncbi:MarR family winged helix-turn-helix transcriptional regulator [Sneathiella limimaris]|uniref:MarR family winged helix-turn-helix transcriptional regulator n=1 Tax=Sneathiella limimaris TaxID=1964213 RepID=UPI00146ABA5D|nr:MarR family winged helix-turn-helix transcriptional regulator [Sneathiella limimaris]
MENINPTRKREFELGSFFPYLVRIFYRSVSSSVSNIYATRFNLSVSEWRTMAVLGSHGILSASEIVEQSSMDKVNVSRAVKALQKRGFLKRDIDGDDKRKAVLRLTDNGREAYQILAPLLLDLESTLLEGLSEEEVATLLRLMEKVRENANKSLSHAREKDLEHSSSA